MKYLSKSRFKQAVECPDKLFYSGKKNEYADSRDDNDFLRALAMGGIQVGELAKCYFPDGIEVEVVEIEEALRQTQTLMQRENVTIFEAAVTHQGLLVRIDVLEKKGNVLNLYEAKSKSYSTGDEIFTKKGNRIKAQWRPYVYDIAFQVFVTRKAFPSYSVNGSLFLINKNIYCTVDALYQKFLVRNVNGRYKAITNKTIEVGDPILRRVDLGDSIDDILAGTETLNGNNLSFEDYAYSLGEAYQNQRRFNVPVSTECKSCEYRATDEEKANGLRSGFEECWTAKAGFQKADFDKNYVFEIWNFKSGEVLSQGRYLIEKLTKADFDVDKTTSKRVIPPHERRWLQVERVHNPSLGPYFDKAGFTAEIRKLKFPLHFIDFEATRNAIPYIKGLAPYTQLAFQFSHHTIDNSGHLVHAGEWIERTRGIYPNFDFIRNLKNNLDKDDGTILIYSPYENSVLLCIYDSLNVSAEPDRIQLMDFIKNITWSDDERGSWLGARAMVDIKNWVMDFYYSPSMKGSNSIKVVLPAIINDSKFVRHKYPEWIKVGEQGIVNPYRLLPPVFDNIDRLTIEPLLEDNELADGGAAMCAFNLMQFSEMSDAERTKIIQALLQYCKLDTLAMVMLYEGLSNFGN